MAVEVADVQAFAPELTDATQVATALAQARRRVNATAWGSRADDGVLYLACHLATLAAQRTAAGSGAASVYAGPVVSETVGPLSRSYAVSASASVQTADAQGLGRTSYGQEFLQLRSLVFACRVLL